MKSVRFKRNPSKTPFRRPQQSSTASEVAHPERGRSHGGFYRTEKTMSTSYLDFFDIPFWRGTLLIRVDASLTMADAWDGLSRKPVDVVFHTKNNVSATNEPDRLGISRSQRDHARAWGF